MNQPHPAETIITVFCFGLLIFVVAPEVVRWIVGVAL
jgi:hypothetical protein